MAVWKGNKVIKIFNTEQEFIQNITQNGFDKYLFFFKRSFDEHIKIIKNIKNDNDNDTEEE
jgi:hypothetical protein